MCMNHITLLFDKRESGNDRSSVEKHGILTIVLYVSIYCIYANMHVLYSMHIYKYTYINFVEYALLVINKYLLFHISIC